MRSTFNQLKTNSTIKQLVFLVSIFFSVTIIFSQDKYILNENWFSKISKDVQGSGSKFLINLSLNCLKSGLL